MNRFVYACALCRELCNTQAHYSRTLRLSSFLSLSLSLSLESKANTKVVSKLSCERVFIRRKRPTAFLRERERERESFRTRTRAEKHDHARLYHIHARFCVRRKERLLRELDFCFRSRRRSSDVVILVEERGKRASSSNRKWNTTRVVVLRFGTVCLGTSSSASSSTRASRKQNSCAIL